MHKATMIKNEIFLHSYCFCDHNKKPAFPSSKNNFRLTYL